MVIYICYYLNKSFKYKVENYRQGYLKFTFGYVYMIVLVYIFKCIYLNKYSNDL